MKVKLEEVFEKTVAFLNKEKFPYIVIGGIAAGTLGEPRMTMDIDVDILLSLKDVSYLLGRLKKSGFSVNKKRCLKTARDTGIFQITYAGLGVDFIITSTDFEREALRRRIAVTLYGIKTYLPTPEDLILLKIIPARPQDLLDAERVAIRHKAKLDLEYLNSWAQKLSDEAQDIRIWNELKRILAL